RPPRRPPAAGRRDLSRPGLREGGNAVAGPLTAPTPGWRTARALMAPLLLFVLSRRAMKPVSTTRSSPMEIDSLTQLYVEDLQDLYSAEKQILQALPKMVKKATNPQLKKAFEEHLRVSETHVERLERIF